MNTYFINHIKIKTVLLFFGFCFLFAIQGNGQEVSKSKRINDSIIGEAVFQYYLSNQDTIFNGSYEFNSTKQVTDQDEVVSYNYEGSYEENQKSGQWVFSRKELAPQEKFKEKDYKVTFLTAGKEFKINANFKEGLADGDWQVVYQEFEASKPTDTAYTIQAQFKDAVMVNQLSAESSRVSINGKFTEEGLLDGDWEIVHKIDGKELKEIRTYEKGVFKSHHFLIEGKQYTIEHIGLDTSLDEDENWVDVKIRDHYFQIIELTNFGFDADADQKTVTQLKSISLETNQFLKNALLAFGYDDDFEVWNSLPGNQAILFGKFKVRKFSYSDKEKKQLNSIKEKTDEVEKTLEKFFSNSQIEIGKLNFESLNKHESILKQYQNTFPKLKKLVAKISQPAFEYVIREALFPNFDMAINFNSEIQYSYQEENFKEQHSFPNVPDKTQYSIDSLDEFVDEMHQDVHKIDREVKRVLEDLSKQEALNEDEKELVAKKAELKALYLNEKEDENYNEFHENLAEAVVEYADQVFEAYVKLPVDQKKDKIQATLTCFEKLINTYIEIADLPRKLDRIDNVYTRTSFNPYLMVDMSERIKERVYKAFEDYLFPSLMKEINENINCQAFPERIEALETIYNKMVELSDQDTSAMEKELRREKDADKIKQILLK